MSRTADSGKSYDFPRTLDEITVPADFGNFANDFSTILF